MRNLITSLIAGVLTFLFIACSEENSTVFPVEGSVENISSSLQEIETSSSSIFSSNTAISSSSWEPYSYGELIDERDGQIYKTIKIGEQIWMAENLNFAYSLPTSKKDSSNTNDKKTESKEIYGKLYRWSIAMDSAAVFSHDGKGCGKGVNCGSQPSKGVRGICPENWHIPNETDIKNIIDYSNESYDKLIWLEHYWFLTENEDNEFKTEMKLRYEDFWTSAQIDRENAKGLCFGNNKILTSNSSKGLAYPIRCVKDDEKKLVEHGELTDERDGQVYKTVKIGNQWWMAENLNYNDSISLCYNNDLGNCTKYGRLYSWEAAMDCKSFENTDECYKHHYNNSKLGKISRGICPMGWHIPSEEDFSNIMKLTNENVDAIISTYGWNNDKNGSDILGLEILPAGMYSSNENLWIEVGEFSYFWTTLQLTIGLSFESKDIIADEAFACSISSQDNVISLDERPKFDGYSIRCTKDE